MDDSKYITIDEMIERDLNKNNSLQKQNMYQIQATHMESTINIVNIGEFAFVPTSKILELTNGKYFCKLLSLVIPHDELENDIKCMISFFISRKKNKKQTLCRLSYAYISTEQQFCICIEKPNNIEIISKYNKYHGAEESIYLLTQVLLREDVKKKLFN